MRARARIPPSQSTHVARPEGIRDIRARHHERRDDVALPLGAVHLRAHGALDPPGGHAIASWLEEYERIDPSILERSVERAS